MKAQSYKAGLTVELTVEVTCDPIGNLTAVVEVPSHGNARHVELGTLHDWGEQWAVTERGNSAHTLFIRETKTEAIAHFGRTLAAKAAAWAVA